MMGSPDSEMGHNDKEGPVHEVYVDGFWMGKYEVTNAQYRRFRSGHDSGDYKGKSFNENDQPVVNVSWNDADAFAEWLSKKTGHKFRLSTEAEWEYACRAGTTTPFYFGDTISADQANYDGRHVYGSGRKGIYRKKTTRAGSFPANAFKLHDMHGNVWEWCRDWYKKDFFSKSSRNNPECEDLSSHYRVLRGGSWNYNPWHLRCANRHWFTPDYRNFVFGFRLIRLPQEG